MKEKIIIDWVFVVILAVSIGVGVCFFTNISWDRTKTPVLENPNGSKERPFYIINFSK